MLEVQRHVLVSSDCEVGENTLKGKRNSKQLYGHPSDPKVPEAGCYFQDHREMVSCLKGVLADRLSLPLGTRDGPGVGGGRPAKPLRHRGCVQRAPPQGLAGPEGPPPSCTNRSLVLYLPGVANMQNGVFRVVTLLPCSRALSSPQCVFRLNSKLSFFPVDVLATGPALGPCGPVRLQRRPQKPQWSRSRETWTALWSELKGHCVTFATPPHPLTLVVKG